MEVSCIFCQSSSISVVVVAVQRFTNSRSLFFFFSPSLLPDDDLQLIAVTPGLNQIFEDNPHDVVSGGIFEADRNKNLAGETWHTESIFFPKDPPYGEYIFFVNVQEQRGVQDAWQVVTNVNGQDVAVKTGSGASPYFYYDHPECHQDGDCGSDSRSICKYGRCLSDGTPRFTLTWDGGDDLDLYIITPQGNHINFQNNTDEESGGELVADLGRVSGKYLEYAFFDLDGDAPLGTYTIGIDEWWPKDEQDEWELTVHVGGEEVELWTGVGEQTFTFNYDTRWMPGVEQPECVLDSECATGEVCISDRCIVDGTPRFTLLWEGDDDLDFFILPPVGDMLYHFHQYDEVSGGNLMAELYPIDQAYVEYAYFGADGSPAINGDYHIGVRVFNQTGELDPWEITVNVGGSEVQAWSGQDNAAFTFTFAGGVAPPPGVLLNDYNPIPGLLSIVECQVDGECSSDRLCASHRCIPRGTPRFTLTWEGEDDLDLFVATPTGGFLSFQDPFDEVSGGEMVADFSAVNGQKVESAAFGSNAPMGDYAVNVHTFTTGAADTWVLTVNVDGAEVQRWEGTGSSQLYVFRYGDLPPDMGSCIVDADCFYVEEVCTLGRCIVDGTPRFTLSWAGDNDLDLYVQPPVGGSLFYDVEFDAESGGEMIADHPDPVDGVQVEYAFFGIYFPAPVGDYVVSVAVASQAEITDSWTLTAHVQGQEMQRWEGTSPTDCTFSYDNEGGAPRNFCDSCVEGEVCAFGRCVVDGTPRFTLSWPSAGGGDDLDLYVAPPIGAELFWGYVADDLSGGVMQADLLEVNGNKIEYAYFTNAATGTYGVRVDPYVPYEVTDIPVEWVLTVHVNGQELQRWTGQDGAEFSYIYWGPSRSLQSAQTSTALHL